MNNTSLHHRQTAPRKFHDPYIIAQVLALLTHAQKDLIISNHAKNKHKSYDWNDLYVERNGQHFDVTFTDEFAIKSGLLFSTILSGANDENIFEIVLADYEVIKLALRIDLPTSPDTDIILVLGGELETDRLEYRSVKLVTWYLNEKSDNHDTLQKERYSHV